MASRRGGVPPGRARPAGLPLRHLRAHRRLRGRRCVLTDLARERCVACRRDAREVSPEEIAELERQVPSWEIAERDGVKRLTRDFAFPDFAHAAAFTDRVGALAEQEDHHPEILTAWGRVTVTWWTHRIRGLHRNDFIMAAKTDALFLDAAAGPAAGDGGESARRGPKTMNLVEPRIEEYLRGLLPPPDAVRAEMERLGAERRFPIIGPLVGRLCSVMARAIGARKVFEMGSGFGYSTLWFARAVGPGGLVVHTEGSADNSRLARGFLDRAEVADRVRFEVGDAREILDREIAAGVTLPFDVVFNDIDKEQYPDVLPRARRALRAGGLLICDNMIWSGRVLDPRRADDATRGVIELTRLLAEADDFVTTLIPIRDGVTVSLRVRA